MGAFYSFITLLMIFITTVFGFWVLYTFIRSGFGKYPPAISSFGNMNRVMLSCADEILSLSKKSMQVIDMGSGTGKILRELAAKYPEHRFIGYEWDMFVFILAKVLCRRYKNITLYRRNFMSADIADKDLIIVFCGNEIAKELSAKILKEAKSGVKVISEAFRLPSLPDEKEYEAKTWGFMPIKVFTYSLP